MNVKRTGLVYKPGKKTQNHTFSLLNLPRLSPLLVVSDVEAFCLLDAPPHIPVALLEFTL